MSRYRVAIIAGQLAIGGAEKQLQLWLSTLDRDLFEPSVVTLNPDCGDYWESSIRAMGIPLTGEPHRGNWVARLRHIIQLLKPFSPHLIHGWHLFTSPYAGLAGKMLGAKSIGSFRGSPRAFHAQRLETTVTRHLVDCLVVNSEAVARELTVNGIEGRKRIRVVPNAIEPDVEDRAKARRLLSQRFGANEDFVWLGSMGRLIPGKRFDVLLEVIEAVHLRMPNIHFFLAGDGPDRERLREKAQTFDLAQVVTFTGLDPDARKWLSALDIFCFTSIDEGLPNVVMEAAAARVPVLAWRTPFLEELLEHDVSASLVTPGDVLGFENALTILVQDKALRRRLGRAARDRIMSRFNMELFDQRLTATYLDVLQATESNEVSRR